MIQNVNIKLLSRVQLFATPWTVAYQAPLSMGFSRQQYWSGLPFPSPRDLPNPGIEPGSPASQTDALSSEPPGKSIEKNDLFAGSRSSQKIRPEDKSTKSRSRVGISMCPAYNTRLFLAQILNPLRAKQMQIKISLLSQTSIWRMWLSLQNKTGSPTPSASLKPEKLTRGKVWVWVHRPQRSRLHLETSSRNRRENRIHSNGSALPNQEGHTQDCQLLSGTSFLFHEGKCQKSQSREVPPPGDLRS